MGRRETPRSWTAKCRPCWKSCRRSEGRAALRKTATKAEASERETERRSTASSSAPGHERVERPDPGGPVLVDQRPVGIDERLDLLARDIGLDAGRQLDFPVGREHL